MNLTGTNNALDIIERKTFLNKCFEYQAQDVFNNFYESKSAQASTVVSNSGKESKTDTHSTAYTKS